MLNRVRKFLKNHSPDWLNTEVNKDLLQNFSAKTSFTTPSTISPRSALRVAFSQETSSPKTEINVLSSCSLSSQERVRERLRRAGGEVNTNPSINSLFPEKGTPHWRRIRQVYQVLETAPENGTYNQLIAYVRETTGQGCSRKLISKWKKQRNISQNSHDRDLETAAIAYSQTTNDLSTACPRMGVNSFQLTEPSNNFSTDNSLNRPSLLTIKALSYLAITSITIALVGWELIPLNNNRLTENVAIASINAPSTPLPEIPERRKNRLEPRNIKIELTLSNPQDLKVKPGEQIAAGQILSDRVSERNRLQAKKKQLQLSLEKLHLPLTPIAKPQPIPEIAQLPPVSYAEAEAAIKLKQQQLTKAETKIANQQAKINHIHQLLNNSPTANNQLASPSSWGTGGGNLKLILEHEQANLKNLEAARQSAQIQLELAQSKLTTAKENRAYIEYQRELEQTRRAIALEQQWLSIQRTESERSRLIAEREYSQAQIEAKIQEIDYQISRISTVTAPYEGTIKKIKWIGQSDNTLTVELTLSVNSDRSTLANSRAKPNHKTEVRETTEEER
ncbi:MAG: hypothetical protein QNJ55_32960 [Xenococcus sp. MO_188.B8]|nr:hypothetical protein [Xenococcus sp. MO_188.B8]